jgi:hypothetical protein
MCGGQNDPLRDELPGAVDAPFLSIFLKSVRVDQQPGPLQGAMAGFPIELRSESF